ncbi:2355_t:CDS:2, partial [Acaulospora colombiana]
MNDTDESQEWLNVAIEKGYIRTYDFNSFENFEHIANGSFGKVQKAYLKILRKTVVLKSLRDNFKRDPKFYKLFVSELRNINAVKDSDNVISFMGISRDGGNLREYLEDLHQRKRFSDLGWPRKIQMAKDIASGLYCIHASNIIHRDLIEYSDAIAGRRETPVDGTPLDYVNIYTSAWKDDPEQRPAIEEILELLENIKLQPVYQRPDNYNQRHELELITNRLEKTKLLPVYQTKVEGDSNESSKDSSNSIDSDSCELVSPVRTEVKSYIDWEPQDLNSPTDERRFIVDSSQGTTISFESSYRSEIDTEDAEEEERFNLNDSTQGLSLEELRERIKIYFAAENFSRVLDLWEIILGDPNHTPEDQKNASECQIGDRAGRALADTLSKNTTLEILILFVNQI